MKNQNILISYFVALICCIALSFTTVAKCAQSSQDYYNMAKALYAKSHIGKGNNENEKEECAKKIIGYCTNALDLNDMSISGASSYIYNMRGDAYSELKEYHKAIDDFTTALNLDEYTSLNARSPVEQQRLLREEKHLSYIRRILAYYELKYYDKAVKDCTYIIENDKYELHHHMAYLLRAQAYFKLGAIHKANKDMKAANSFDLDALMKKENEEIEDIVDQRSK